MILTPRPHPKVVWGRPGCPSQGRPGCSSQGRGLPQFGGGACAGGRRWRRQRGSRSCRDPVNRPQIYLRE